jgi:hypothetical protein
MLKGLSVLTYSEIWFLLTNAGRSIYYPLDTILAFFFITKSFSVTLLTRSGNFVKRYYEPQA